MSDYSDDEFMNEDYDDDYEFSEGESDGEASAAAAAAHSQPSQLPTQGTYSADAGFDDDDDFFEDGADFEPVLGLHRKKPWEVDFAVHSPDGLRAKEQAIVDRLEPMLALPRETTTLLLHEFSWKEEPLLEDFLLDKAHTLALVGLAEPLPPPPQLETGDDAFVCEICFCDGADLQFLRLSCGHRFCSDCYTMHVSTKVQEGGSWRIRCAAPKCATLVGLAAARLLLDGSAAAARYEENLMRSFVKELKTLAWCPAPNCEFAVECTVPRAAWAYSIPTVRCRCGAAFCFGCHKDDHVPAPCELVERWLQKCKDDSETSNWIKANTKECIKCKSTIEKNGGCNHMTCRECHHEFCWVCMGPWKEHGQSFYSCNRFDEDSSKNARDSVSKSRAMLERYLHYFTRYNNHEQSAKLARKL
ncbi:hypothetical protein IWW55_006347, partial [Coemansia sp. RSA 2706]